MPGVVGAAPYVDGEGMVRGERGEIVAVRVRGIDPERVGSVTDLREDLLPGSEGALDDARAPTRRTATARASPASSSAASSPTASGVGVGDTLVLISPFGGPPTPLGPGPRLERFRVAGVFQSSFFQYDEVFTYTSLAAAQDFRRTRRRGARHRGAHHRLLPLAARRRRDRRRALGFPYFTRDWKEFFPAFFQALKTERVMMFVLLTMIMVVAAFAIVVTLIMMIMEKSSDIAILKTMGASDAAIERIFAIEGTLIGLLGTAARRGRGHRGHHAAGLGAGADRAPDRHRHAARHDLPVLDAALGDRLRSRSPWWSAIAMVLALGATLLPSRHGARLDPAEALRYE